MNTTVIKSTVKKNLPVGVYLGYWSGHQIKINHDGEEWFLETKDGVRGINVLVTVGVSDSIITVAVVKQ